MAAFTHLNPEASRFSDGTFGVFYAARAEATAIRETVFHRERFLAATTQPAQQVTMRCYVSSILRPLYDVRVGHDGLHDPDPGTYPVSAAFARVLRLANSEGISYRSVRHAGGECVAVFWPDNLTPCVQGSFGRRIERPPAQPRTPVSPVFPAATAPQGRQPRPCTRAARRGSRRSPRN